MTWRLLILAMLLALTGCSGCDEYVTEPLKMGTDIGVIAELRAIYIAQTQFRAQNNKYGTFEELKEASLIDAAVASGNKHKYVFTFISADEMSFAVKADPDPNNKLSTRHFYVDQTGLVRACEGRSAGPGDSPATM